MQSFTPRAQQVVAVASVAAPQPLALGEYATSAPHVTGKLHTSLSEGVDAFIKLSLHLFYVIVSNLNSFFSTKIFTLS